MQFNLFKWRLGKKCLSISASFLRIICKMSHRLPPLSMSMLLAVTICQGVTHILRLLQSPLHPELMRLLIGIPPQQKHGEHKTVNHQP